MKLSRESRGYRAQVALVGILGALLIRALGATWRIRTTGPDPFARRGPVVAALWHSGLLVGAYRWRGHGVAVPISRSRDGDLMDAVLRRLGFAESPRGSSSRGAAGLLRSLIRCTRRATPVAMLPDGPRGPARRVKTGVVALARASGAPLVPVGVAASRALHFGSWDRAILPLPFARVECHYGEALEVPKQTPSDQLDAVCRELETRLDRAADEAARALADGGST